MQMTLLHMSLVATPCLFVLIERIHKKIDEKGFAGVLLTDLSRVFE